MSASIDHIRLSDYHYDLPESAIAQHPLAERDSSKLLYYKQGHISHHTFRDIADLIPQGACLFFNNTKVIPARILMQRNTGAGIEIFLLQPHGADYVQSLAATGTTQWQCLIGNRKKWKAGETLHADISAEGQNISFNAVLSDAIHNVVTFNWEPAIPFATVLEHIGKIPLPPYIKRSAGENDANHYQTVYARLQGAVAAPTAGLHFTPAVMESLKQKGVWLNEVTLHVGAGTFLPVTHEFVAQHDMHTEQFVLRRDTVEQLLKHELVYCVGTTSMRVIESVYQIGKNILEKSQNCFFVEKLSPYKGGAEYRNEEVLTAILQYFEQHNVREINALTQILIMPGYRFRFVKGLITNFHMPATTLILLVAAFTKTDWQEIYQSALKHDYRFLSYGDSSLLVP